MFTAFTRELLLLSFGPVGDASAGPKAEAGDVSGQVFLGNGTGANEAEHGWHDERTLAASANEDIDLQTQVDNNNVALGLTEVVVLRIAADPDNGHDATAASWREALETWRAEHAAAEAE